tara:strand:- start:858 stop:1478 length:621 start_codon:yes stop_codon:yes gene_type:complete
MRQKTKIINYYKIDDKDLPDDLKQKILDKLRQNDYYNWFAEDEYICEPEVFHGFAPTAWDLDRGNYIQFEFVVYMNEQTSFEKHDSIGTIPETHLRSWLGIPKTTWDKVDHIFINEDHHNTYLAFTDAESGDPIDFSMNNMEEWIRLEIFPWDFKFLEEAIKKFEIMMDKALVSLREAFEYQISDENMIDMAEANDWEFDESGEIV